MRTQKDYSKAHYDANVQRYVAKARRNKNKIKDLLLATKDVPCMDCRVKYPPYVMDFDHVRGEKSFNLYDGLKKGRLQVMTEIQKCDVVCSNCHRIRTQERMVLSSSG